MYEGGIAKQRRSVSDTAQYGDYVSGPRIIDDHVKENMQGVLADVQNGAFAKRFIDDQDAGAPEFKELRARGAAHPIEAVWPRSARPDGLGEGPRRRLRGGQRRPLTSASNSCRRSAGPCFVRRITRSAVGVADAMRPQVVFTVRAVV